MDISKDHLTKYTLLLLYEYEKCHLKLGRSIKDL
nr:hypothetical protein MACL_00000317 [Theileria orientalis]